MKVVEKSRQSSNISTWLSILVFVLFIPGLFVFYLEPGSTATNTILIVLASFFMFNFAVRKSLSFKNYFTHKYNPFTSKYRSEVHFDISEDLMFEKVIEVLEDSPFKLAKADEQKLEILAYTNISLQSWGENLYVSFETVGGETIMKVSSVTFFQVLSWGKNKSNTQKLLSAIESSLTV